MVSCPATARAIGQSLGAGRKFLFTAALEGDPGAAIFGIYVLDFLVERKRKNETDNW